jgi:hypothetical protein
MLAPGPNLLYVTRVRRVAADWRVVAVAVLATAVVLRTKVSPLWVIAAGAAAGVAGII